MYGDVDQRMADTEGKSKSKISVYVCESKRW